MQGPPPAGLDELINLFDRVVGVFVSISFIALLVILVIGGIKFITSGGNEKSLESAWQTITWGLLGILFLILAWLILLLINQFTNLQPKIDLTQFGLKVLCKNAEIQFQGQPKPTPLPWCQ